METLRIECAPAATCAACGESYPPQPGLAAVPLVTATEAVPTRPGPTSYYCYYCVRACGRSLSLSVTSCLLDRGLCSFVRRLRPEGHIALIRDMESVATAAATATATATAIAIAIATAPASGG